MSKTRTRREYDRDVRPETAWRKARRTGYRTDRVRHIQARAKVTKATRIAIARKGGAASAAKKKALAKKTVT